jgi:hypothetical protein
MQEKEWDEVPEKKIYFGETVDTPDGEGVVTEFDPDSEYTYHVYFKHRSDAWYREEDISKIA